MVQTCVVACSSLAFSGGFGCYLLSMDSQSFRNAGSIPGNRAEVPLLRDTTCFCEHHAFSFARHTAGTQLLIPLISATRVLSSVASCRLLLWGKQACTGAQWPV